MIGVLDFVRATNWYGTGLKYGVVIEICPRYIKVETASGIFTCHRDSAKRCKNLTPLDEKLLARVARRLTDEAAAA